MLLGGEVWKGERCLASDHGLCLSLFVQFGAYWS